MLRPVQNDAAAPQAQAFVLSDFCSFYLEWSKFTLRGGTAEQKDHGGHASGALPKACVLSFDAHARTAAHAALRVVLDVSLRLLHPFMPFVTESLWQRLHFTRLDGAGKIDFVTSLALAGTPSSSSTAGWADAACDSKFAVRVKALAPAALVCMIVWCDRYCVRLSRVGGH